MSDKRRPIPPPPTTKVEPLAVHPTLPAWLAGTLTFIAVAAVLVLEIAAARVLAPYVGVSLTTYTGIIGVILGGIALGAWAGGRAADAWAPTRLLGPTLLAGGLTAVAAVPLIVLVGGLRPGSDVVSVLLLTGAGFFAPAAVLSAVAPMIVRASIVDVTTSGALVGRLSAIGTLGALVGTFLTGFVLLGLVPTRPLIIGVGVVLALIGLALSWHYRSARLRLVLGAAAILALAALATGVPNPCERDSAYFCISVDTAEAADPYGRILYLDGLPHAYVNLKDSTFIPFPYIRWFAAASQPALAIHQGDVDVLHLGGGGFSFPRYLVAVAPESRHLVLELDPAVLAVARDELGFTPDERIEIGLGDARPAVALLPDDSFDLAVGDAFASRSVPWHLTTTEFLRDLDRVLRPDGVYMMNLIDHGELWFAKAEMATLQKVFTHVVVVIDIYAGGNIMLVASQSPIDALTLTQAVGGVGIGGLRVLSTPAEVGGFADRAPILTDDYAPVDQLISH